MRQAKKVAGLGLKALLALVGGVAAMFGVGTSACAAYGPKQCLLALVTGLASLAGCGGPAVVEYGPAQSTCGSDAECARLGAGWYCDRSDSRCAYFAPTVMYGPSSLICSSDADCARFGVNWYCGSQDLCGAPDAGSGSDSGTK